MNNICLLLKTLLLSTSQRNIFKYTTDKKKKRRIIANAVGFALLYLMIMAYCIVMCVGYGTYGFIDAAPVLCALLIKPLQAAFKRLDG